MAQNQRPPEAFRSTEIFEQGIGYVCVSRFKSGGRVESGVFLVDVFCLGVKDAYFQQSDDEAEYIELLDRMFPDGRVEMTPAEGRKFVEHAVAYAASLGFAPAADYKKGARAFGGIHAEDWQGDFMFGKDGKPFFIAGPNDSPARCQKILTVLEAHCGSGNYDYLIPEEMMGNDALPAVDLEEMARRYRNEHPGTEIIVNPPGVPKMSDQLSELVEPLVDDQLDLLAAKSLFQVAALAWNYPLFPSRRQERFLEEMTDLLGTEGIEVLEMLIERRKELFPNDRRLVTNVEVSEGSDHRFEVRVAYAPEA